MEKGAQFFNALKAAPIPRIAIENPLPHGYATKLIGHYQQRIQPWEFGHGETKGVCLWLKNLPPLMATAIMMERKPRIHLMSPGPSRSHLRSVFFTGIAAAMAKQWGALTAIFLLVSSALGQQFEFSRLDGSLWTCDATAPQLARQIGAGHVGTATNSFNGSQWWIDSNLDALFRDGAEVGRLAWFDGRVWDAQRIHGFALANGYGWLASQDADDANHSFLVRIDLTTAAILPIGPMGDSQSPVDGLIVIPEPSGAALLAVALLPTFLIMNQFSGIGGVESRHAGVDIENRNNPPPSESIPLVGKQEPKGHWSYVLSRSSARPGVRNQFTSAWRNKTHHVWRIGRGHCQRIMKSLSCRVQFSAALTF